MDEQYTFFQLNRVAARPYTRAEYKRRLCWLLVESTVVRWSLPRSFQRRGKWLRRFGADMDPEAGVRPRVTIRHPWKFKMGAFSILSDGVEVYNLGPVSIGEHTVVSQDVYICAGTHDHTRREFPLIKSEVHIGSGVWIAAGAFIGPGVTIGDNAIIGARAVVMRDVPAGVVVSGNPAKIVRDAEQLREARTAAWQEEFGEGTTPPPLP